jgi:hypothetical protein
MSEVGYADILRALGRFLDDEDAHDTEIVEHPTFLAITWRAGDSSTETRSYNELDLQQLREKALSLRGGQDGPSKGELCELLRTMGQELDAMDFDLSRIQEDEEGFIAAGAVERRYESLYFRKSELRELSAARAAERHIQPDPAPRRAGWRFWQH